MDSKLIRPPIRVEPPLILSDFRRIKKGEVRKILQDNCNTCPFSFLDECFNNTTSFQMSRIFLLAFFGLVIFPHHKNAINPSIAWIVQQVCAGRNFANTILAETFLSLARFKENKGKVFHAPSELLQIWCLYHIKGFGIIMAKR